MLKRFLSLILALLIGGSVLTGAVRPSNVHFCKMAGMGIMPGAETMGHDMEVMDHGMRMPPASPSLSHSHEMMLGMEMTAGMETMPCCMKHGAQFVSSQSGSQEQCCVTIPQETGSSGTAFKLRPPSLSIAVIHPAVAQSPLPALKPHACPYSTQVFSPDLQASYIRNLSLLI